MNLVDKYLGEVVSSKLLAKMVRNVDKSKKERKERKAKSNKKLIGKLLGK